MNKKIMVGVGLLVAFSSCGGDSHSPTSPTTPGPTPTPVPTIGRWTIAVTPSPIVAVPSGDPSYPWRADWHVTITDAAGLSGNINRVVTTAENSFGGTFVASDYNPDDFIKGVGTSHIDANGTYTYFTGLPSYRADGNGGKLIVLNVVADIVDDSPNHNHVTASTFVNVTFDESRVAPLGAATVSWPSR